MSVLQELPRFPCWCKATYSWGGETKKDLGFIEGDLIEALNAGDGQWWMGRLRRDPRAVGLFPSNFVQVLEESFRPAPNSRNSTPPMPLQSRPTESPKSRSVFRKPYQAYGEFRKRESLEGTRGKENTPESDLERNKREKSKFRPYSSMKTVRAPTGTIKRQGGVPIIPQDAVPRIPSPLPRGGAASRPHPAPQAHTLKSKMPPQTSQHVTYRPYSPQFASHAQSTSPQPPYRTPSPAPPRPHSPLPMSYHDGSAYPQILPTSRSCSPHPPHSRPASPMHEEDISTSSPPPPPPPAHRVTYRPSRAASPQSSGEMHTGYHGSGTSPHVPPSPDGSRMTPSPLRNAMNDVMNSLQDMTGLQNSPPPDQEGSSAEIWSPDEFEDVREQSLQQMRAQSSLGFQPQLRAYASFSHGGAYADFEPGRGNALSQSTFGPRTNDLFEYERQISHVRQTLLKTSSCTPQPPPTDSRSDLSRPLTSDSASSSASSGIASRSHIAALPQLRHRKSAFELGRDKLHRTYTTKTNATSSTENSSGTQTSNSTQLTSRSIMSGYSAGGFSATSAGSLARHKFEIDSQGNARPELATHGVPSSARSMAASDISGSGPSYHDSHASGNSPIPTPATNWPENQTESAGVFGGLASPTKSGRSGFFKRMVDAAKTTARTGAANARSTFGSASHSRPGSRSGSRPSSRAGSPNKSFVETHGVIGGTPSRPSTAHGSIAPEAGPAGCTDWMQVRRDVNRSNSLSQREREERIERCEMHDIHSWQPIQQLRIAVDGDEGLDRLPVAEPTDFNLPTLALVDKSTRFLQNVPQMISPTSLAQSYVCRPHRSDVQRLRAIFTWVAERINWEEDYEGQLDPRRAIQTRRACSEEIAVIVRDMCLAVGLHAEVVRGYLKSPGETVDLEAIARPNHCWNAVIADGEWRIMDCALASPTHPRRSAYSAANSQVAESWYFLVRPMEICYTHIPLLPEQQHIVPTVDHDILASLPFACPAYFRNGLELADFNTSMLHLQGLEMAHVHLNVPEDIECVAETEARAFTLDADGDLFESGGVVTKPAFAQADWVNGEKRYTIKAVLPSDEGHGVLKVYAGKKGLMHSIKDNPHSMAVALPLTHTGQNPRYDFVTKHPTPHAQRHDLYIAQPQCSRLTMNNTFVFCVRQHPSSLSRLSSDAGTAGQPRPLSPNPLARPNSAMSMVSAGASQTGSQYSDSSSALLPSLPQKPAKLAIQSPSQKITRLTRKQEYTGRNAEDAGLTTTWETVIKIGERGAWRGLVLADRSARWCVFAEWECA